MLARFRGQRSYVFSHMWNICPPKMQAMLYIHRNIYRVCVKKWDQQRRPREEEKKERKIVKKIMKYLCVRTRHKETC
jgi:hypothetical protein